MWPKPVNFHLTVNIEQSSNLENSRSLSSATIHLKYLITVFFKSLPTFLTGTLTYLFKSCKTMLICNAADGHN